MLSFNTCGGRIIWLCACTNLGLGTHGSTVGNTGVKTCTVRGLFGKSRVLEQLFFCIKDCPAWVGTALEWPNTALDKLLQAVCARFAVVQKEERRKHRALHCTYQELK